MAQMTVELRTLLKTKFELFDFDYNFDDDLFKKEIEQHIIDYFYFYEIAFQSPDRFKHQFKTRWLSMVDYYNRLHNTTLLSYNPLINYKISEALEQLSNTTQTSESESQQAGSNTQTVEDTTNAEEIANGTNKTTNSGEDNTTSTNVESSENRTINDLTDKTTTTGSGTSNSKTTNDLQNYTHGSSNTIQTDYIAPGLSSNPSGKTETTDTGTQENTGTVDVRNTNSSEGEQITTKLGTVGNDATSNSTTTNKNTTTGSVDSENTNNRTANTTGRSDSTAGTESSATGRNNTDTNNTSTYSKTIERMTGTTYQDLILKERETMLRIKQAIVEELKPLFILVY